MSSHSILRRSLGVAVVGAAALVAAVPAQADFSPPLDKKCEGESIIGGGASFQAFAHQDPTNGFITNYINKNCKNKPFMVNGETITYNSIGSGAGRALFGGSTAAGVRNATHRFAAWDEPPTPAEQATMEAGDGVTGVGNLMNVPVASGAVAIIVNFPDGCSIPEAAKFGGKESDDTRRFVVSNTRIELAFRADPSMDTWGELFGGADLGSPACNATPIKRVVRNDSSGTTFQFKLWLNDIEGTGTVWPQPGLLNQNWPNAVLGTNLFRGGGDHNDGGPDGPVEPDCNPGSGGASGNDNLSACTSDTDGSIGYADLKTARLYGFGMTPNSNDDTFWIPLTNGENKVTDPQLAKTGFLQSGKAGANCKTTVYQNVPLTSGSKPAPDAFGNWEPVTGVSSEKGYPVCTLTYVGIWEDYADVYGVNAAEEAQASTVKHYVDYMLAGGQGKVGANDYAGVPGKIKTAVKKQVKDLNLWNE